MNKTRFHSHGFTLLELLVVILIIGLLTGVVAPRFLNQISRSELTTAKAQIDAFGKAIEAFRIDMGRYPSSNEGLKALLIAPGNEPRWHGPYLKDDIPQDPWGMPYRYAYPSTRGKDFDLLSNGPDKMPGGLGDAADVTN